MSSTPADAQRHLGNVYKGYELDETDKTGTSVVSKPITAGQFLHQPDSENVNRKRFEAFVTVFTEYASQDDWTTIRYALEQYAEDTEARLFTLLNGSTGTQERLPNHVSDRQPGHLEEVALAAELVQKANTALMAFKGARSETSADV